MKNRLLITFLFVVFSAGTLFALDRDRKIEPIIDARPVLTKSLYTRTLEMDPASRRLIYVSYVSGFVDAMQLNSMDNETAKKFLEDCKNLTLGDLIDMMVSFKETHPEHQDISPAIMLTVVIPRLKQGLTPLPEKN